MLRHYVDTMPLGINRSFDLIKWRTIYAHESAAMSRQQTPELQTGSNTKTR